MLSKMDNLLLDLPTIYWCGVQVLVCMSECFLPNGC